MQPNSPLSGKKSTRGLAALQGLIFYESGFSVLDLSKMNWLPKQYPNWREEKKQRDLRRRGRRREKMELLRLPNKVQTMSTTEHRTTGHAMMLAPQGIVFIGGLGYNARFQSDVQLVKLF